MVEMVIQGESVFSVMADFDMGSVVGQVFGPAQLDPGSGSLEASL